MSAVITMLPNDLRDMTAALVPHAEDHRKSITPILQCIHIDPTKGNYAWATNRYTAGRLNLRAFDKLVMPEEPMLIPAYVLTILSRIGPGTLPAPFEQYVIRIEETAKGIVTQFVWASEDKELEEVHWQRVFFLHGRYGDFPPVQKLFDKFQETEVPTKIAVNGDGLDTFVNYAMRKHLPVRFTADGGKNTNPILVEIGTEFRGLIAPSIRGEF